MWIFEPHVAEAVFEDWIEEEQIPVFRDQWLNRQGGVKLEAAKIRSIRSLQGDEFFAEVFVDATYEGDLLAAAGVSYEVGRESMDRYQEKWAGVQTGVLHHRHHFGYLPPISPYRDPDDPSSGVLPLISETPPGEYGYLHDGNRGDGAAKVRFVAQLPADGIYQVRLYYPANSNRATNAVVEIQAADGKHEVRVNQRQQPADDQPFVVLGDFPFRRDQPAAVLIHNRAADGYVIADAIQWVPAQRE